MFIGVVNCDSDSDGISVISETEESLKESSSDDLTQDFFTSGGICDENEEVVENIGDEVKRAILWEGTYGCNLI